MPIPTRKSAIWRHFKIKDFVWHHVILQWVSLYLFISQKNNTCIADKLPSVQCYVIRIIPMVFLSLGISNAEVWMARC